jgi:hypothetical protein
MPSQSGAQLKKKSTGTTLPLPYHVQTRPDQTRQALRPIQPPIQWAPGAILLGVKWLGCEADHSHPSSAEVKECMKLDLHSPNTPSWRGAQLKKSTGITLPLPLYPYITFMNIRKTAQYI